MLLMWKPEGRYNISDQAGYRLRETEVAEQETLFFEGLGTFSLPVLKAKKVFQA